MKPVIVIPTYNEKDNVEAMAAAVLENIPVSGELLFVDDNSPDGTGEIIDSLCERESRIHCLHRTKKEGLGRAYIAGFKEALRMGADKVVEMDCDFSHPVESLMNLLSEDADVVIGSRYARGGKTVGWPFKRWLISRCGGLFIRFVTGLPIMDPTGGFKCFKREVLERINLDTIESNGYSFQLEMNYRIWKEGFSIKEIPITFSERRAGHSKISGDIAIESIKMTIKLRWRSMGWRGIIPYFFALIGLVAFFVTVWHLNVCFRICSDDCFYGVRFIEPTQHVKTVANAFADSCKDMHRPLVHFLVRCFCGVWPKWVFNICNTIMLGLLIELVLRHATGRWFNWLHQWVVASALVFLVLCKGESYLWIAGSVNYLWTGVATLAFCLIHERLVKRQMSASDAFLWLFPVLLMGWTNEAFAVSVLFGIVMITILRKFRLTKAEWMLYSAFVIGVVLLSSGELWRIRLVANGTKAANRTIDIIKIFVTVKAVWLLVFSFCFIRNKRKWLSENSFELFVILGSIMMIAVVGFNGERSLWPANLFAIILLMRIWRIRMWHAVCVSLLILPLYAALWCSGDRIAKNFDIFLNQYLTSDDFVAKHERVFLGPLSRFFYQEMVSYRPGAHGHYMAYYYGREHYPVGLPGPIFDEVYLEDSFCSEQNKMAVPGDFYTRSDVPIIVHPFEKEWHGQSDVPVKCIYSYPSGILAKMKRAFHLSEYPAPIQPELGFVLDTAHGKYLLISKEFKSDKYIQEVKTEYE